MEKQERSKIKDKVKEFVGRYNTTTIFLAKFVFQQNFQMLKKSSFVNAFITDPDKEELVNEEISKSVREGRTLYLLFRNKKMAVDELAKIVTNLSVEPVKLVHSYELVNDYSMIVLELPKEFNKDYELIIEGSYSKLSEKFRNKFEMTQELVNSEKQRLGKEYTLYYHIFNKTEWLQQFWMDRLNLAEIDEKLELWEKPEQSALVFNKEEII